MKLTSKPLVKDVFDNYPKSVQDQLLNLRELIGKRRILSNLQSILNAPLAWFQHLKQSIKTHSNLKATEQLLLN